MESKKYSNVQVNIKDIIFVFLPIFISVVIQYTVVVGDIVILFLGNLISSERSDRTITLNTIMERDYNQPMNMAYMSVAKYLLYGLVFCIWYYRAFIKENLKDKTINAGAIVVSSCKNIFTSIIPIFLVVAGYGIQLFVDAVMSLIRPFFAEIFANYDELVNNVVGVYSSWIMLVAVCLLAPIVEEFMFRGLVQRYALKFMPVVPAIILQGLLFGLYHGNIVQGVYAFILGTLLGLIAYKYKALLPSIILHMAINVSMLFVPQGLFKTTTSTLITAIISGIVVAICMIFILKNKQSKTKEQEA